MAGSKYRPEIWTSNGDWYHLVITVLAAGGFYGTYLSLAPAYTLSYELLYYFLWSMARKHLRSPRNTFIINMGLAVGYLCLFPHLEKYLPSWLAAIFTPIIIICYVAWLVGAAISNHLEFLLRNRVIVFSAKFSWLILILFLLFAHDNYQCPSFIQSVGRLSAYYSLLGLCFALIIVDCYSKNREFPSQKTLTADHKWGLLSYPLYLLHGPIIIFIGFIINWSGIKMRFDLYFLILIASALMAAWMVCVFVEKPMLEYRKKYLARR